MSVTEQAPFIALANTIQDNIDRNIAEDAEDNGSAYDTDSDEDEEYSDEEEEGILAIQNPDNMEGGRTNARPPITPAIMLQRLINKHNQIQQIANIRVRHDRLDRLIERYTEYAITLNDEDVEPFNELLDDYSDELVDLGEQIDQQQNPDNMEGGRMCRCCRRQNCDCATMCDFNVLHGR
jgi:hypothetical protein